MTRIFSALALVLLMSFAALAQRSWTKADEAADRFTEAAEDDDLKTLQEMLDAGIDINAVPGSHAGWTALMAAATFGKAKAVKFLIAKGANVKIRLEKGETPLIQAAQSDDNEDVVKALVEAGADLNAQTKEGLTALMRFAWMSQTKAFEHVFRAGADTKLVDKDGDTAFRFAVAYASDDIVRLLLPLEKDVNQRDKAGRTPLMWTAWEDRSETLSLLISAGANVNAQDNEGKTPLMYAARQFFINDVKVLLAAKADADLRDKHKWTALMYASQSTYRSYEIGAHGPGRTIWLGATRLIDVLAPAGTNINAQNDDGDTALILAVKSQNTHFAESLVKNGADPNIKNSSGKRAVDYVGKKYYQREALLAILNKTK
jgi:ankyrin repeat protein